MNIFEKQNWILLKGLVKTDFKLRYQGSFIGYLWSILKPILLFIVMYAVFVKFLRLGEMVPHFAVALLLGITLWNFFGESTGIGMTTIVSRGDLLRKISFPKPILIVAVVMNALINFGISLVVVLIFAIINGVHFSWTIIAIIPLTVELVVFTLGVTLLLSTVYVYFRDLAPVWEVVMQAGFYATPIIYPISQITTVMKGQFGQIIARLVMLNPMAQIVQDFRYVLTYSNNMNPTAWQIYTHHWYFGFIPVILSFLIFWLGLSVFNKRAKKFAEVV
ncbi:MAG: ABC transporter permease [Streptococcaceae bacterium]|jgi:ABC-2 type transport system permease protein|nr:ABC transporter permease [Streptococcaceae bacterium]